MTGVCSVLADLVQKGAIALAKIPAEYKKQVENVLNERGKEGGSK